MENLLIALDTINYINRLPLEESILKFEEFTNQIVPKEAINDFKFLGLNNVDFYTSDFLNKYGVQNLLQNQKTK